jgi:hypothetical protein
MGKSAAVEYINLEYVAFEDAREDKGIPSHELNTPRILVYPESSLRIVADIAGPVHTEAT